MGKFWTLKYDAVDILRASNGLWLPRLSVKIPRFLRIFATIASAMVPIRDINRGWIQAAKLICHFGRGNRVNAIVVYDFFCLSSACRESEKESRRLNADLTHRLHSGREMILCRYGWL